MVHLRINCTPVLALRMAVKQGDSFVDVAERAVYRFETGPFFYIRHGEMIDLPHGRYELFFSAGARFMPMIYQVSGGSGDVVQLDVVPVPLLGSLESGDRLLCDADLHIHGPQRDSPDLELSSDTVPLEILAENIAFPCLVDKPGLPISFDGEKALVQASEYRNGTYGHLIFLGGFRSLSHKRVQYYPDHPFPVPTEFLSRVQAGPSFLPRRYLTCILVRLLLVRRRGRPRFCRGFA